MVMTGKAGGTDTGAREGRKKKKRTQLHESLLRLCLATYKSAPFVNGLTYHSLSEAIHGQCKTSPMEYQVTVHLVPCGDWFIRDEGSALVPPHHTTGQKSCPAATTLLRGPRGVDARPFLLLTRLYCLLLLLSQRVGICKCRNVDPGCSTWALRLGIYNIMARPYIYECLCLLAPGQRPDHPSPSVPLRPYRPPSHLSPCWLPRSLT